MAAAAVLDGRAHPGEADLWPLICAIPTREEQTVARECLRDLLAASRNASLPAAAEAASAGPAARAHRLLLAAEELLAYPPAEGDPDYPGWRLKLEGIGREIDAGFATEQLPEPLRTVREQLVEITYQADGSP
jgi:MoxR-like ATPase